MITITRESFRRFAPKAKPAYVKALFDGIGHLEKAGILDSVERWSHFIGQCAAETDGFTILRESLDYRTVRAVRAAWPKRSRPYSDAWIEANLLRKPVALGDWAYGGREGNRKGTSDGFDFRGGGWLQTTHRNATAGYCTKCGFPMSSDVLDDPNITLDLAILERPERNCNAYADAGDILAISKIINTGSASSGVIPNGLDRRRQETARALDLWSGTPHEAPTRPWPAAEPHSAVSVAASSPSVHVMGLALLAKLAGWCETVFGWIPEINTEVTSLLAPLSSLAGHLKINIAGITTAIVVGCIVIVVVRHTRDKGELKHLKGE